MSEQRIERVRTSNNTPTNPNEALYRLVQLQQEQNELLNDVNRHYVKMLDVYNQHLAYLPYLYRLNRTVQIWFFLTVILPLILGVLAFITSLVIGSGVLSIILQTIAQQLP